MKPRLYNWQGGDIHRPISKLFSNNDTRSSYLPKFVFNAIVCHSILLFTICDSYLVGQIFLLDFNHLNFTVRLKPSLSLFKEVELLPWMTSDGADEEAVQYSTVCNQLKVAFNPDTTPQHRLFGMSSRNRLYCDDLEIATGIR